MDKAVEERPRRPSYRFAVGHDREGRWIVCDIEGTVGGVFQDRASAIKFAMDESEHQSGQVLCVPDTQVLSINVIFSSPPGLVLRAILRAA